MSMSHRIQKSRKNLTPLESGRPESEKDQEKLLHLPMTHPRTVPKLPSYVWGTSQRKYADDLMAEMAPWWKELFFKWVYLPFTRWCLFSLKIFPPSGQDTNGEIFWTERQGDYVDRWKAEQDAAKYPFGIVTQIPLDSSLRAETVLAEQDFPNSPAREKYKRRTPGLVQVEEQDLRLLKEATDASKALVGQHKTAASQ